jgi:pullulanase
LAPGISAQNIRAFLASHEIDSAAHWISADTLLLPKDAGAIRVNLLAYPDGLGGTANPEIYPLKPIEFPLAEKKHLPHLADFQAYRLKAEKKDLYRLLRGRLLLGQWNYEGLMALHNVQTANVLDDLFTSGSDDADEVTDYGVGVSDAQLQFTLWAPTARQVSVAIYDKTFAPLGSFQMSLSESSGVWRTKIPHLAPAAYYRYVLEVYHPKRNRIEKLEVTDPYSLGLSANSQYSLIVDLRDPATKPQGWDAHSSPDLSRPERQIIYEAHIGDFSATDSSTPAEARGRYSAFDYVDSAPVKHLSALVKAGLNTFHILPAYDSGSVNEIPSQRLSLKSTVKAACTRIKNQAAFCKTADMAQSLRALLESYPQSSSKAQAVIEAIDEVDDFNWGYDPLHYTVPEGSYASDANGIARIVEFRQMIQNLHEMGLRVVMDMVYNHTYKSGLDDKSTLDKVVPGYYHRRHPISGAIETSTCCENTATEHVMMGKLMVDSLLVWTRDYKIDGYRFDLMGHQPRALILKARKAVQAIDPDNYFYGEGWNFGEVANNKRFVQATQSELGGTEIGTFTDRLRDAVRGGSAFAEGVALRKGQGIGNGQFVYPNELTKDQPRADYDNNLNLVRLGLAGNLKNFEFSGRNGNMLTGAKIQYGGGPAGYALDPADTINYVSAHDNQTLWDNHQYRLPFDATAQTRMRLQTQSLSYVLYAQGIPFLHMGSEILRSKSFLRDSYNYGHWFNRVDFTYGANNYNVGLPPADKDKKNWDIITTIIKENQGRDMPDPTLIKQASDIVRDMISIRSASQLFSLETGQDIRQRVTFLNTSPTQQDGLIVLSIDDGYQNPGLKNLDPESSQIIIIFNHSPKGQIFNINDTKGLHLHEQQQNGADPVVRQSRIDPGRVSVPAFTSAVFVREE